MQLWLKEIRVGSGLWIAVKAIINHFCAFKKHPISGFLSTLSKLVSAILLHALNQNENATQNNTKKYFSQCPKKTSKIFKESESTSFSTWRKSDKDKNYVKLFPLFGYVCLWPFYCELWPLYTTTPSPFSSFKERWCIQYFSSLFDFRHLLFVMKNDDK